MSEPRIILFDLETLPNMHEAMKVFPSLSDYPGQTLKASINSIICFGWKVYGGPPATCINAWDFPEWKNNINNDHDLLKQAREILSTADAVITHNGKRFDWKFIQTRLLINGLKPLPKIPHIDTCALAKQHLYLFNNRLNTLAKLIRQKKLENGGWDLWVKVSERNDKAMALMSKYCIKDVALLEPIYKKIRPLISNIPNHNLFSEGEALVCPSCGSFRLKSQGWRYTSTQKYRRLICKDCHSWSRTDVAEKKPRSI